MIAPKKIYCFWFGNTMSIDRKKCFKSIVANSGVKVILITEKNIDEYIHPDYPLHPGFSYLSATHKSDYLRSYFMHVYGGGYTDIKECCFDWNPYFDDLNTSDKLFNGSVEKRLEDIAYTPVSHAYKQLVVVCQFIFKPQTSFTKLWYDNTQKKMNEIYNRLIQYPGNYHPRAIFGGAHQDNGFKESKYPLEWNELLGRILHKLQYENIGKFLNTLPYPNTQNYR